MSFVLSHMRATNAQISLHNLTVSSHHLLLELKKRSDADERSGPIIVPSKAVVLLLLIHSLIFLLLDCGGSFVWSLLTYILLGCSFSFCNHLDEEERA